MPRDPAENATGAPAGAAAAGEPAADETLSPEAEGPEETGPVRTCILTRVAGPTDTLIRFVADPEGRVVPDIRARLPGRGVWVSGLRASVEQAGKRKLFARGLRREVAIPPNLADEVDRLLAADALQSLAMANKAGQVIAGFAKVEAAITGKAVALLLAATDAAEDGRRKLQQAVLRRFGHPDALPVAQLFDGSQMGLALGREHVIHACLLAGAASQAFVVRGQRLHRYRSGHIGG
jgi:predicted RNA-binding protein YlxR (DUF448 family)